MMNFFPLHIQIDFLLKLSFSFPYLFAFCRFDESWFFPQFYDLVSGQFFCAEIWNQFQFTFHFDEFSNRVLNGILIEKFIFCVTQHFSKFSLQFSFFATMNPRYKWQHPKLSPTKWIVKSSRVGNIRILRNYLTFFILGKAKPYKFPTKIYISYQNPLASRNLCMVSSRNSSVKF